MFDHDMVPHASMMIAYDFDHTLHLPKLSNPEDPTSYLCDQNGFLGGELLEQYLILQHIAFAKKYNIPMYVITARPDNAWHRNHIIHCIENVDGFHDGVGGFKKENIICLGLETYCPIKKRPHVETLTQTKLAALTNIHQEKYPYLPKSHVVFLDDEAHNIAPIANAGYSTFQATVFDKTHQHLHNSYQYMTNMLSLPFVTTLGNYAVLLKSSEIHASNLNLKSTEHLTPAQDELAGSYWRQLTRPDYPQLAENAMGRPELKSAIARKLAILNDQHQLFFTSNREMLEQHILTHSYGTVLSMDDLAKKDTIILLGSEGKRKYTPLKKALASLGPDLKNTAIIGFPAESGVDLQPVGHEDTLLGARNRLKQLCCLRETLQSLLNHIVSKYRMIACLTIESGIGLLPVERISQDGTMQVAQSPLYSAAESTYHFYDQTHILLDTQQRQLHVVTRPAFVHYTLCASTKESLMTLFEEDKPTPNYYLKQSEWSWEMLRRQENHSNDVFPTLSEEQRVLTVSDLIEERLRELLSPLFQKTEVLSDSMSRSSYCCWFKSFTTIFERDLKQNPSSTLNMK